MKRKRKYKIKFITLFILIILDVLLIPSLIQLPKYLFSVDDPLNQWANQINAIDAISSMMKNKEELMIFATIQIFLIPVCVFLFWNDKPNSSRGNAHHPLDAPPAAGNGEFGSSRFLREKEIPKYYDAWKMEGNDINGGIVLGAVLHDKSPKAWVDKSDVNTNIVGTSRSGKTRKIVFPTIYELSFTEKESMLLTDPKGELYERSAPFLRDQGFEVKVIDFRKPGWGNFWNPLQPVIDAVRKGDIAEASKHAWTTANMFVYQKPGSDSGESIWKDGAESVIAALILAVVIEAPRDDQKHMYSVYKTLAELGKSRKVEINGQETEYVALNDYIESLPLDHPARDAYATAALAPERTRGSFFSNVASLLRLFADPSIRYLTSKQDHVLHEIGMKRTAVFLIIPDEDKTRHPLAALYIDQTYKECVEFANNMGGRLPIRVNKILDEFGNMPPIKDFDTKLTVSLGRGIRWNIILQDFAQLDTNYGQKVANTIRGNCHNMIYLLTTDEETAANISRKLGNYTISSEGSSYNVQKNSVNHGGSFGLSKRELLTAEEILRWPAEYSLCVRARQHPAFLPLPDLSEWPADQALKADNIPIDRIIHKVSAFIPDVDGSQGYEMQRETAATSAYHMDDID